MDILEIQKTDLKNTDLIIEISCSSNLSQNGLHKVVSINPMPVIEQKKQSKQEPYWLWYQKRRN